MLNFNGPKRGQYKALADLDVEAEQNEQDPGRRDTDLLSPAQRHNDTSSVKKTWVLLSVAFVIFAAAIITSATNLPYSRRGDGSAGSNAVSSGQCENPSIRREWRDLSDGEKMQYIGAISCLHETPSRLDPEAKLSDDFPWLHFHVGSPNHNTVGFLSWHRWFIHLYEEALRDFCGWNKGLVYWDWSLDWQDPASSPIWDSRIGFGGDGDLSLPRTNMPPNATCVRDGPFSNYQVRNTGWATQPHCLSRGFGRLPPFHNFSGEKLHPDVLNDALAQEDFWDFVTAVEDGPHDAISHGVGGDFMLLTAPNDPVFYLHHTQIDRLWWMWQQKDPERRLYEYHGPNPSREHKQSDSAALGESFASLDDVLTYEPLSRNITVRDIMSTKTRRLCYRY
ncbi:hypothetical protein LTS17_006220 [Exophiala oligosperma]